MIKATKRKLIIAAKGFCMGTADIVPGVSGGTMAYILGIYEKLLAALRSFDLSLAINIAKGNLKYAITHPHWGFLIPLGCGILSALIFFTKIIPLPSLVHDYPEYIFSLFFGLISGSIFILMKQAINSETSSSSPNAASYSLKDLSFCSIGTIIGLSMAILVPINTPDSAWFIFICGALAITAMLLPGVSGAFILLILGKYATILDAASRLDLSVILPLILGMATGVIIFSRAIGWLLKTYHRNSLMVINGILIGSLWRIWPFQERTYEIIREKSRLISQNPITPDISSTQTWVALCIIVVGLAIIMLIDKASKNKYNDNNSNTNVNIKQISSETKI